MHSTITPHVADRLAVLAAELPDKHDPAEPIAHRAKLPFEGRFGLLGLRRVSWHEKISQNDLTKH
jgi:hypothetical protein